MKGKYTLLNKIDSICQEWANQFHESCPLLAAITFMLGGSLLGVIAVERNITSKKELTWLAIKVGTITMLIMLIFSTVVLLVYVLIEISSRPKMDKILNASEPSDLLFSGPAFHIKNRLAEEGWLFLTKKELIYIPATTKKSFIDDCIIMCEMIIAKARADKNYEIKKEKREKTLNLDMIASIRKKNRYLPTNKVVITTRDGWDLTFHIRDMRTFLSCFDTTPAEQAQMAHG